MGKSILPDMMEWATRPQSFLPAPDMDVPWMSLQERFCKYKTIWGKQWLQYAVHSLEVDNNTTKNLFLSRIIWQKRLFNYCLRMLIQEAG